MPDPTLGPRRGFFRVVGAAAAGYALGTIPSARLASAAAGRGDIRALGTGNPGAANAMGQLGTAWGIVVLGADVAKGAVAATTGRRLAGDVGAHAGACAAVAGHCYPVWSGFSGGKGVATSVGQTLVTFPAYFVPDLAVAGLTNALPWWRHRAHGAVAVSAAAWTAASVLWWRKGWSNLWGPAPSAALPVATAASCVMILHRFHVGRAGVTRAAVAEVTATG